jgi:hypothetical protein
MRNFSSQANAHSNEQRLVCQARKRSFSPATSLRTTERFYPRFPKRPDLEVGIPQMDARRSIFFSPSFVRAV